MAGGRKEGQTDRQTDSQRQTERDIERDTETERERMGAGGGVKKKGGGTERESRRQGLFGPDCATVIRKQTFRWPHNPRLFR